MFKKGRFRPFFLETQRRGKTQLSKNMRKHLQIDGANEIGTKFTKTHCLNRPNNELSILSDNCRKIFLEYSKNRNKMYMKKKKNILSPSFPIDFYERNEIRNVNIPPRSSKTSFPMQWDR